MSITLQGPASSPGVALAEAFVVRRVEVDTDARAAGTPDEGRSGSTTRWPTSRSLIALAESMREARRVTSDALVDAVGRAIDADGPTRRGR